MAIKTAIRLAGKHSFFWVALFIGVLLLGFYVFAGLMIYRYGTLSKDFGWEYNSRGDQWYVSGVDPNGVAANKLEPGDRIIAIDGDKWITRIGNDLNLHLKTEALPAQSAYTIRVERGGTQQAFELSVPLRRGFGNFSRIIPMLVVSILFGILAMLLRARGRAINDPLDAAALIDYTEAARALGVHPNYLHRLIRNLNLKAELKK